MKEMINKSVFQAITGLAQTAPENEFPREIFELLATEGLLYTVLPWRAHVIRNPPYSGIVILFKAAG
jgi:hypothetical protein